MKYSSFETMLDEVGRRKFGFGVPPSKESAIEELEKAFGGTKGAWFISLLRYLADHRDRFRTTEIYLAEGHPIKVAKPLIPFPPLKENVYGRKIPRILSRDDVREVVRPFFPKADKEDLIKLILERKSGVDFSFAVYGLGIFRCNFSFYQGGLHLAVRWLDFEIPSLESMNYPPIYQNLLTNLLEETEVPFPLMEREQPLKAKILKRGGLILHTGATSSGKTTSIASEINYLANNLNGAIFTYENPIEYQYLATKSSVIQYDVDVHFGGSFEGVLKHLLRNTPNVALIGEVRTLKEIDSLIDIASRGHLIFSTMHSGNVEEAFEVLFQLEGRESQIATSLLAIVSHRLLIVPNREKEKLEILPLFETLVLQPLDGKKPMNVLTAIREKKTKELFNYLKEEDNKNVGGRINSPYYVSFKSYLQWLYAQRKINAEVYERALHLIGA